jgi:hypothetical protein
VVPAGVEAEVEHDAVGSVRHGVDDLPSQVVGLAERDVVPDVRRVSDPLEPSELARVLERDGTVWSGRQRRRDQRAPDVERRRMRRGGDRIDLDGGRAVAEVEGERHRCRRIVGDPEPVQDLGDDEVLRDPSEPGHLVIRRHEWSDGGPQVRDGPPRDPRDLGTDQVRVVVAGVDDEHPLVEPVQAEGEQMSVLFGREDAAVAVPRAEERHEPHELDQEGVPPELAEPLVQRGDGAVEGAARDAVPRIRVCRTDVGDERAEVLAEFALGDGGSRRAGRRHRGGGRGRALVRRAGRARGDDRQDGHRRRDRPDHVASHRPCIRPSHAERLEQGSPGGRPVVRLGWCGGPTRRAGSAGWPSG